MDDTYDPEWPNVRRVPLGNGRWAVVDADKFEYVMQYRWAYHVSSSSTTGYVTTNKGPDGCRVFMHRLLMNAEEHLHVDHKNHDGLDNRCSNLRLVTRSQNQQNGRKHRDNKSGFKGVDYRPHCSSIKPWRAKIKAERNQPQIHIGYFPTAEDAARAHDEMALLLHGEYACLNFPTEPLASRPRTNHEPDELRRRSDAERQSQHKGVSWGKHDQKWRVHFFYQRRQYWLGQYVTEEAAIAAMEEARRNPQCLVNRPVRTSSSEYRGVSWAKKSKRWLAKIKHEGKNIYIGLFDTPEDAARAFNTKALELRGDRAQLNVIAEDEAAA